MARKHRLEDEQDGDPPSKRTAPPLKVALDEGFSAESDTSSEKDEDEGGGTTVTDERDEAGQDGETEEDTPKEDKETSLEEEEAPATEEGDFCSEQLLNWSEGPQDAGSSRPPVTRQLLFLSLMFVF